MPELSPAEPERIPRKRDAEVLEAAARVFYARGYSDASVQDVADEIGILKGSVYHYVKSKEDLLYRLLDGVHADVRAILLEVASVPDLAPLDRLHLYLCRQIEYNARNLQRITIYYQEVGQLSDARRKTIRAHRAEHEDFVTQLIRQAQDDGDADDTHRARIVANYIFGSVIWVYHWFNPEGTIQADTIALIGADFALAGVRGGFGAQPSGG